LCFGCFKKTRQESWFNAGYVHSQRKCVLVVFKRARTRNTGREQHMRAIKELCSVVLKKGAPGKKCAQFNLKCVLLVLKGRARTPGWEQHMRAIEENRFYCFKKARQRTWWKEGHVRS
jgi:hypothetical protein